MPSKWIPSIDLLKVTFYFIKRGTHDTLYTPTPDGAHLDVSNACHPNGSHIDKQQCIGPTYTLIKGKKCRAIFSTSLWGPLTPTLDGAHLDASNVCHPDGWQIHKQQCIGFTYMQRIDSSFPCMDCSSLHRPVEWKNGKLFIGKKKSILRLIISLSHLLAPCHLIPSRLRHSRPSPSLSWPNLRKHMANKTLGSDHPYSSSPSPQEICFFIKLRNYLKSSFFKINYFFHYRNGTHVCTCFYFLLIIIRMEMLLWKHLSPYYEK